MVTVIVYIVVKVCLFYLEEAVLVAMLTQPHSTAQGQIHLRWVYHSLINPANNKQSTERQSDSEISLCLTNSHTHYIENLGGRHCSGKAT